MFNSALVFMQDYGFIVGAASFVFLVASMVITALIIAKLPSNFWLRYSKTETYRNHLFIWWMRNILAIFIAIVGLAMLVLPGQGLVTLLLALVVSQFPWKRRLILKLLKNTGIRRGLNAVRRKLGKQAFIFEN